MLTKAKNVDLDKVVVPENGSMTECNVISVLPWGREKGLQMRVQDRSSVFKDSNLII